MAQVVAAMFDKKTEAEAAADELKRAGDPNGEVHLLDRDDTSELERTRIPADHRRIYERGLREGAVLVAVRTRDEDAREAEAILNRHHPIDVEDRFGRAERPAADTRGRRETAERDETIPVVEEELDVSKRQRQAGGVRVHSHVVERPVEEDVKLRDEHVDVERRKVDRPVSDADDAFRERTIEARETREEPVVSKRARVVEEIVLHKESDVRTERVKEMLKKTEVDVEKLEEDFRRDVDDRFGGEYTYDQVSPAYRYGYQLGMADDRDWAAVEPEARRRFEERNPGTWDRFGSAVRHGFERARANR